MRWIWLPLILLTAVHAQPPSPPGFTPVLSPKQKELKESWGTPMIKVSYSPGIPVPLTGFAITNLSVANNQVSLSWINGVPPFQVIGEPTLYGPWSDVGNPTTARSKVFPEDINHFFTVQGNIVMPLEATQTNNLTRLTWEAPDTDMSDSLQAFTLKRSTDNGATFPNTVAVVQPGGTYSVDDTTAIPPGGSLTWELLEQTLNGVVVPYSKPVASNVAPGTAVWAHGYGGTDHDYAYGLAVDQASGAVYACGQYGSSADFGTGTLPAFGSGNGWLAKYSSSGSPAWAKGFGIGAGVFLNSFVTPLAVAVRSGFVAMVGSFSGTVDFSSTAAVPAAALTAIGAHDAFIALYTDTGTFVWAKSFGTPDLSVGGTFQTKLDCSANGVAIDSAGNVSATGQFQGHVNFGDSTRDAGTHGSCVFAIKLAAGSGATDWSKQMGSVDSGQNQGGTGMAVDFADGTDALYVTGQFTGVAADFGDGHTLTSKTSLFDVFVAKYRNSDGECLWANGYGGNNVDQGLCIAAKNGVIAVGGIVNSTDVSLGGAATGIAGGFVAKYSGSDGTHLWSQGFSLGVIITPPTIGTVNGVALDGAGNVVAVGSFTGTISLPSSGATNPINISSSGSVNIYVVKFSSAGLSGHGDCTWAKVYHSTGGPFGGGGPTYATACGSGPDNSPVVTGAYSASDASLSTFYVMAFDGISVPSQGREDVFIVKMSP